MIISGDIQCLRDLLDINVTSMYLRKSVVGKGAKGATTAGQIVATRAGRTRRNAAAAAMAAAAPPAEPDVLLAGPLPQEGAAVGVGARRKVTRKATQPRVTSAATLATAAQQQEDVS